MVGTAQRRLRVLLVDDHPDFLRQGRAFLERSSLVESVTTRVSAEEGLGVVSRDSVDLVVVDFVGTNTDAFVRCLKRLPWAPRVLVMSLNAGPEYRLVALASGADGFVWKGQFASELIRWIGELPRGRETVLLVEDDDTLRNLTGEILQDLGYTVLPARDGLAALEVCEKHDGPVHLLLTDMVMPRMNGRELAECLRSTRPETAVLFLSGYTDDAVVREGMREAALAFLQKPFTAEALARKVRELLEQPREPNL